MQGVHLRKYGVEATIPIELFEVDGVDFRVDAVHASGDTVLTKDEGAEANTDNGFTDEGSGYSIVLTATEMQAARISTLVVDQTATKIWLDTTIVIETYGHASAQHALDLDDAVRGGMAALPDAAADAAGGLPISDAGGLDLDAMDNNINNIPTVSEFIARTLVAASYFDPAADTVANVTTVTTLTGNTVQTGDNFARIGVAGAGLTAINLPNQTMDITGNLSGSVGSVTARVTANTDQIDGNATSATNLSASAVGIEIGAAIAGTLSVTQMTTDITEDTDDHFNGRIIVFTGGALLNQATDITDYTGATKLLTFTALTEAPVATDTFVIV